jgi:hypothetical protein
VYTSQTRRGFVSPSPAYTASARLGVTNTAERLVANGRRSVNAANTAILLNRGVLPRNLYSSTHPLSTRSLLYFGTHRPEGRSAQTVDQA